MRVYIASSWKNAPEVLRVANVLRAYGHEVDAFCDDTSGRFVFSFDKIPGIETYSGITIRSHPLVRRAFQEDRAWLNWADAVLLLLPAGKSAHLEAGYAKGRGKRLFIVGEFPKGGGFDVMYGFADALGRSVEDILELLSRVQKP
jgi:hypothetical protein